jgi:uncharacterized membrane protein YhaH (DUF805 family)
MIPTIPRIAAHDRAVPRSYLVARNAFAAVSIVMGVLVLTMIVLGIFNGDWGADDGTGFVIPAWLVIALGSVPPVATIVMSVHLTCKRVDDLIGFLAPAGLLFVIMPLGLSVLYPDPTGLHWDPNDEYWNPDDPRAHLGWHWIAALPQVVTIALILAGVVRFSKEHAAERAAAIAEWKRTYGQ